MGGMPIKVLVPFVESVKPSETPLTKVRSNGMSNFHPSPAKVGWEFSGKGRSAIDASNHGGLGLVELMCDCSLRRPSTRPEINNGIHRTVWMRV